jgi:hypothetical protein
MYLQQGDVQLVSNHFVLHARTEFTDYTEEEIAQASATAAITTEESYTERGKPLIVCTYRNERKL